MAFGINLNFGNHDKDFKIGRGTYGCTLIAAFYADSFFGFL